MSAKQVAAERDLWCARYEHLAAWVAWFREDICHFSDRPGLRMSWQGLNRDVGREDLFIASVEIEAEVRGDLALAKRLAESKDKQFRALALQAAEVSTASGKTDE